MPASQNRQQLRPRAEAQSQPFQPLEGLAKLDPDLLLAYLEDALLMVDGVDPQTLAEGMREGWREYRDMAAEAIRQLRLDHPKQEPAEEPAAALARGMKAAHRPRALRMSTTEQKNRFVEAGFALAWCGNVLSAANSKVSISNVWARRNTRLQAALRR